MIMQSLRLFQKNTVSKSKEIFSRKWVRTEVRLHRIQKNTRTNGVHGILPWGALSGKCEICVTDQI